MYAAFTKQRARVHVRTHISKMQVHYMEWMYKEMKVIKCNLFYEYMYLQFYLNKLFLIILLFDFFSENSCTSISKILYACLILPKGFLKPF